MLKKCFIICLLLVIANQLIYAQDFYKQSHAAKKWVRQQYKKLSDEEKIAQLMVIRAHSNLGADHVQQVTELIKKYNVGALCFFQGGPVRQAVLTNYYQSIAKTPLMICQDAEWGLGMRLDSVINFPHQLTMGATQDPILIYKFGNAVGKQCKRIGVNVNYAPVVDVNNNPENPVINDRSFGEDKYKVAAFGVQYMKGMQVKNVMACAKHFPGHGDVAVDSHLDLPIINKSLAELDSLELYPFRELIKAGVGGVMMAHLYIPAIDSTKNLATSLSSKAVDGLLRKELGYKGIVITDGLEMKGISKFFPDGEASMQALVAGNDMLCLPSDIQGTINKVEQAIADHKLSWKKINKSVKKVLLAKYNMGLNNYQPIDTTHIVADLNAETNAIKTEVARNAITLVTSNGQALPLYPEHKIAYLAIGINKENVISTRLNKELGSETYFFSGDANTVHTKETIEPQTGAKKIDTIGDMESAEQLVALLKHKNYEKIVIGVHNYSRRPANNYGLSNATIYLLNQLQQQQNTVTLFFGNPYAIKFSCNASNLIACYEDDEIIQQAAADILEGKAQAKGKLPVTVCDFSPQRH
jgi:beta-glucosidase-like glycosyl hydrolase